MLVGGSPLWQRGVASLLAEGGYETVIGTELASWTAGGDRSCVLLRVTPDDDPCQIVAFRDEHPHVPLVAVIDEVELAGLVRNLRAGATAVSGESESPEVLLAVVGAALDDLVALPAMLAQSMARLVPDMDDTSAWLSEEEAGWLRAMASGQTVADLAEEVGFSERAMFRQLKSLYLRLGVRNRTEALLWAGRRGLLADG